MTPTANDLARAAAHEAAHCVVINSQLPGNRVLAVEVYTDPEDERRLGVTRMLHDQKPTNTEGLFRAFCVLHAGTAAERLVFGTARFGFGDSRDIEQLGCDVLPGDYSGRGAIRERAWVETRRFVAENIGVIQALADRLLAAPECRLSWLEVEETIADAQRNTQRPAR